jgi:hypothetical protein
MKTQDIDRETIRYCVQDAREARAEALNALLFAWGGKAKVWMSSLGKFTHALSRRGRWNLSLPAPHH